LFKEDKECIVYISTLCSTLLNLKQHHVSELMFCVAAFCPFHIGNFAVMGLQAQEVVSKCCSCHM